MHSRSSLFRSAHAVGVLAMSLAGCRSLTYTHHVPVTTVATPGVRVVAKDGSFALEGGKPSPTPFEVDAGRHSYGGPQTSPDAFKFYNGVRGGRPVWVHVPSRAEPLHGVLCLFGPISTDARGPATRSYEIIVPPDRVAAASNGAVSVVWENLDYDDGNHRAWCLWLSDEPLVGTD